MNLQIKQIILWPKRPDLPPRTIILKEGAVNVISGASKTGKSAIIPIIDYCLGADNCGIPVETIRNSCSWFGILLQSDEGQKLLARKEPGGQKSTGEMCLIEGDHVDVPESVPVKNITAEAVKSRFDELCGLSRLDFDFEKSGSGFKGRPSFRDLVAFNFQPQNIVANPDVLFFKADTYEHREKLKTIFPYVLNVVSSEILAAQHELETVRRDLNRKQRELDSLRNVSEQWLSELRAWAVQAREYGLLETAIPQDSSRDRLISILEETLARREEVTPSADGISDAIRELVELEREETDISTNLGILRRRLAEMSKLKESAIRYRGALSIQRDRLSVAKWLHSLDGEPQSCPVCNSPLEDNQRVTELLSSLEKVENEARNAGGVPLSFDREMARVHDDIALSTEKLKGISLRKSEVEARSQEARDTRFRQSAIARFLGRIESGLEMHRALSDDGSLAEEVATLRDREQYLTRLIAGEGLASRTRRALESVSLFAARLLPNLDVERPDDPIELSITDLTIRVHGKARDDYLWEIGSGANWLAYHVAISLALQQFFAQNSPNPVPSLLVYDQPSQVYFPRRLAGPRQGDENIDPILEDEDVSAVRKVFRTVAEVVDKSSGKLQALILDHAGPDVWNDIPGVHAVEEWRQGAKLVPAEWYS